MEEGLVDEKDNKNERFDDEKETKFPDVTHHEDMEECVGDEIDDKNESIDEEKEAACPDFTPPDYMEEGVGEKKMTRMSKLMRKKRHHAQMELLLMI